ncbi:MAG: NTP transferase domain-containing protein [Oscillospiraceae bacterium]|nr:NTP transferase domain-containing protein [Oscillospiraceae bacterium]
MKKTVVIAAAGVGSRLGASLPKCLIKAAGHTIFEYQLKALQWADEIRMVVGYQADEVIEQVSKVNPDVVFIHNRDFATTNLRQSYFLGAKGLSEKALFLDGDTIIGRTASDLFCRYCQSGEDFVAVTNTCSADPIYAGIQDEKVCWFSYERPSEYELANAAFLSVEKLEYINTLFYVQLEKYLPIKAVFTDNLEIDTSLDLEHAQQMILAHPENYDFWR